MESVYTVTVEKFEGPLETLYSLIEKRKLQINTVSLAAITDGYLAYLRSHQNIPPEQIAQFILVASTLVLIKSKSLLPILEYTEEEKTDVESLTSRLQLYAYIHKNAMPAFSNWRRTSLFVSPQKRERVVSFAPDSFCTQEGLYTYVKRVLDDIAFFREVPKKVVKRLITLEDAINRTLQTVQKRIAISFREMTDKVDRHETIVSFLAVLELVRKNILNVAQEKQFADITMHHTAPSNGKTNADTVTSS